MYILGQFYCSRLKKEKGVRYLSEYKIFKLRKDSDSEMEENNFLVQMAVNFTIHMILKYLIMWIIVKTI